MLERIKKDPVLFISGILAVVSCFFVHPDEKYIGYIDFRVLAILFCMMLVVSELVILGVFDKLTNKLLSKVHSSRLVSLILVWLAFFLGMILTNDVTLVTLVPFAIALMKSFDDRKTLTFTLILMTVATNLGSMQTPIGNPQNIYLFTHYNLAIGHFTLLMLPYSLSSLILVTIAVFLLCKDQKITHEQPKEQSGISVPKVAICIVLFILSLLVVLRVLHFLIAFGVLFVVMLVMDRKAFKGVDYTLLITFVFFFVFVGNMGRIDLIYNAISGIVEKQPVLTAIASSQVISNVPAALLLSAFTQNGEALIIGTNLGGLGTLIASMASLITYKFHAALPKPKEKSVSYVGAFTVVNIVFLVVLLGVYFISGLIAG
ncbi:MAG: citrate transporter [Clostridiales bacterium]|nr:citrate transporter [Clostridiales bacterium]